MQKVKGKVHATLTELKNMIGDVLAATDEHGEVILTSYNKAKYRIEKIKPSQISESDETETAQEPSVSESVTPSPVLLPPPVTHHRDQAEIVELPEAEDEPSAHPAMLMPAPFAAAPVEQIAEADNHAVTHSLTSEEVAAVTSELEQPVPELTVTTTTPDIFSLWNATAEGELWKRDNSLETRWAQVARNLI